MVFHEPYKGKLLACVLRRINWSSNRILFYLLPLKGSLYSLKLIWSDIISSRSWFLIYSSIAFLISYYSINIKFSTPEMSVSILILQVWKSFKYHKTTYPTKLETLIFSGISTNRCIWSTQACTSIIVTPFHSQSCLNIFPISFFNWPYISFLLNLGAKTIWYLQLYFVCDKLLLSIIWILLLSIKIGCEPFLIIDKRSFFIYSPLKLLWTYLHSR